MKAALIVHRWFERGAGWAFAPELQPSLLDLITALNGQLKSGRVGSFRIPAAGQGFLLGSLVDDVDSLDPKAHDRKPTILRAVVMPQRLSEEHENFLLENLSRVWPIAAGPDDDLRLDIPATAIKTHGKIKPALWTILVLTACALIAIATRTLILVPRAQRSERGELAQIAKEMKEELKDWQEDVPTNDPAQEIDQYFDFLSQKSAWAEIPKSPHPYVRFVMRLPQTPPKGPWTKTSVNDALTDLRNKLRAAGTKGDDRRSAEEKLQQIREMMNYESWREKDKANYPDPTDLSVPPVDKVAEFVERFREDPPANGELKKAAEDMNQALRDLKVTDYEKDKAYTVFRKFFGLAGRPNLDGCTPTDKAHAFYQFLSRLNEPDSSGWTCDDFDELRSALQRLAGSNTGNTTELIKSLGVRLSYDVWKKGAGQNWKQDAVFESSELKQYYKDYVERPQNRSPTTHAASGTSQ